MRSLVLVLLSLVYPQGRRKKTALRAVYHSDYVGGDAVLDRIDRRTGSTLYRVLLTVMLIILGLMANEIIQLSGWDYSPVSPPELSNQSDDVWHRYGRFTNSQYLDLADAFGWDPDEYKYRGY